MRTQGQRGGATKGWVVNSTPRTYYPRGNSPVRNVQEEECAP